MEKMQCSVCGQWKMLTRKSGSEAGMQTFYPCCGETGEFEHSKPVCHECCTINCPYKIYPSNITDSFYKRHNWKYFEGKQGITRILIKSMGGEVIFKGETVKLEKRHRGLQITSFRKRANGLKLSITRVHYSDIYLIDP